MSDTLFGIIVPAGVFAFSFAMTWLMYRHFSKPSAKSDDQGK